MTRDIAVAIKDASFVEDGTHPIQFRDGWTVTFSRLLVSIGDITLDGSSLDDAPQPYRIVDMVRASDGSGFVVTRCL